MPGWLKELPTRITTGWNAAAATVSGTRIRTMTTPGRVAENCVEITSAGRPAMCTSGAVIQPTFPNAFRAAALFLAVLGFSQEVANPWPESSLLEPAALAKTLRSSEKKPVVICVAFPVLYRAKHIAGAIYAGPGNTPAGLETLRN